MHDSFKFSEFGGAAAKTRSGEQLCCGAKSLLLRLGMVAGSAILCGQGNQFNGRSAQQRGMPIWLAYGLFDNGSPPDVGFVGFPMRRKTSFVSNIRNGRQKINLAPGQVRLSFVMSPRAERWSII